MLLILSSVHIREFYDGFTMIYKQKSAWECGQYACLNCLQRMWVNISEETMLSYPAMFGFPTMERILVSEWIIKGLSSLVAPRRVYNYLKEWIPLVCLIYSNNFPSVRNPPHIQDFKWKMNHFVCLVEDLGDRLKYVDQQGEDFWDKWHGYIMKDQLKWNTRIFKINI